MFEFAQRMQSIAEIGCWKGRGTHALLSGCKGTVTAIDPFDPVIYGNPERKLSQGRDIFKEFSDNMARFKNLRIWRMASEDVATEEKFDMVFLDGQKSYSAYLQDIKRWLPRTTKVIAGYDYRNEEPVGVQQAVEETFSSVPSRVNVFEKIWYKIL